LSPPDLRKREAAPKKSVDVDGAGRFDINFAVYY
jgi:hypothetical protein